MDPERLRTVSSKGGVVAHEKGTAHEFTAKTARAAGRKGGEASKAARDAREAARG